MKAPLWSSYCIRDSGLSKLTGARNLRHLQNMRPPSGIADHWFKYLKVGIKVKVRHVPAPVSIAMAERLRAAHGGRASKQANVKSQ